MFFIVVIPDVEDFERSAFIPIFLIVNTLTLVLLSLSLFLYGTYMKKNLSDSTRVMTRDTALSGTTVPVSLTDDDMRVNIKLKIWSRINNTLILLLTCYSFRVMALVFLFVEYFLNKNDNDDATEEDNENFIPITVWLTMSWLIPSVPVYE